MSNLSHGFVDLGATNYHADVIARHTLAGAAGFDILPGQLDRGRRADDSPEIKLMRTLVLSAIADVVAARQPSQVAAVARRRQAAGLDASRWIDGAGALITFADACAFGFSVDAATMRAKISALGQRPPGAGNGSRVLAGYSSGAIV